jgi:putative transposase
VTTPMAALDLALISRFGALARVRASSPLRLENGLVFTSRGYTRLVCSYGLRDVIPIFRMRLELE